MDRDGSCISCCLQPNGRVRGLFILLHLCMIDYLLVFNNHHLTILSDFVTQNRTKFLSCNIPFEEPVVLQLGGSHEDIIKRACQLALPFGFCEFNLNVG